MNVLFYIGTLEKGGAERVLSILANSLVDRGCNVEIVTYFDCPIEYDIDQRITITIEAREAHNLAQHILWHRKHLKSQNPDVAISFLSVFNLIHILSTVGLHIPTIVTDRSDPRFSPSSSVVRKMRNLAYRLAGDVVVQTPGSKHYFDFLRQRKVTVIRNPVHGSEHRGIALKTEKRKEIVYVGRLIREKNLRMLIRAFGQIHEDFPDHRLLIFGRGDQADAIRAFADESALKSYIDFKGVVPDIYESIKFAELFLLTSDYEGMPNALAEAMLAGLPCISTKVFGAVDLITDSDNGFLVARDDWRAMAQKAVLVLSNPALASKLGQRAAETASQLSVDSIVNQWIALLTAATARHTKRKTQT